jgi:ureidoacrylate peracid hydrolase
MEIPSDTLPAEIILAATHRRGRLELFDTLEPRRTALVVIDMQKAWLTPGGPFYTPPAVALIPRINRLAEALRCNGGRVIWIKHTAGKEGAEGHWPLYFDNFIDSTRRDTAIAALMPGSPWHELHPDLAVTGEDWILPKCRFSAFLRTAHSLEAMLISHGIETLITTGTATNVCVESTTRDAMMLDFRVFMPHDGTAALDRDAHLAGVRNVMQSFADVRPVDALLALIERSAS